MFYLFIIIFIIIYSFFLQSKESFYGERYIKSNKKIYTQLLNKAKKVLFKLGIPFSIFPSTCIGYYRINNYIPYDHDLILGISYQDYTPKIIQDMEKQGFILYRKWKTLDSDVELSFYYPNTEIGKRATIDIFVYLNQPKISKCMKKWNHHIPKYYSSIKNIRTNFDNKLAHFYNIPLYVISPYQQYLQEIKIK